MKRSWDVFGFYDSETQVTPAFDPGLAVVCPFCLQALSRPLITTSLMKDGDTKSYFYRAHKECYHKASQDEISIIESSLIDSTAPGGGQVVINNLLVGVVLLGAKRHGLVKAVCLAAYAIFEYEVANLIVVMGLTGR